MDDSKVDPPPTYRLRWPNHSNNIIQTLMEQLDDEGLVDVTLSCEKQFLKAHKVILSGCSPYFKELFKSYDVPHPCIILNGVAFSHLKLIVRFMYEGELKVPETEFSALLDLAQNLQIKGLCKISKSESTTQVAEKSANEPSDVHAKEITKVGENKRLFDLSTNHSSRKRRKQSLSPLNIDNDISIEDQADSSSVEPKDAVDYTKVPKTYNKVDKKDSGSSLENKLNDKDKPKIPRPQNAFMIFANEWRRKLAAEHVGESNKEISVRLGNLWKSLALTSKNNYYLAAKKADEDHKLKYPDYVYSPKQGKSKRIPKPSSLKPTFGYPIFITAEAVYEVNSEDETTEGI